MARQHQFSQHFLRSPRIVAALIGHSNLKKRDTVLDIGAGSGVIASVLARRVQKVIAIEPESRAYEKLRANLEQVANVSLIKRDFFATDLPDGSYKVFSNIPFALSAKIVWRLTHDERTPQSIYLIVQRQFAQKMLPDHDGFNSQLGMMIAPWWRARIRYRLHKTDFTPPPAVDTVLLELIPAQTPAIDEAERTAYEQFIERNFTDPKAFSQHELAPTIKPSQLTANDWIRLYRTAKM